MVSSYPSKRRGSLQPDERTWDPGGGTQVKIVLPSYVRAAVSTVDESDDIAMDDDDKGESRTELDSHANMPFVGSNIFILAETGKTADVNAFTPDYPSMQVPVVDAAVQYDCPYTGTTHILVIRNAVSVPSLTHNLIPPFMIRAAGVKLNDTPKIQVEDPTTEVHCLHFQEEKVKIPLLLHGIFSYFPTTKPSVETIEGCEEVLELTPDKVEPSRPRLCLQRGTHAGLGEQHGGKQVPAKDTAV
jgi:hypothetical protein